MDVFSAENHRNIPLAENDMAVEVLASESSELLIWIISETGINQEQIAVSKAIQAQGVEVWMIDVLSALFLPQIGTSFTQIPSHEIESIASHIRTEKRDIYLFAENNSVVFALQLLSRLQQQKHLKNKVKGIVILGGEFFIETADVGQKPEWHPIVKQTQSSVFILQPEKSPWFWSLEETIQAFPVGSQIGKMTLQGLRNRFYYRPDATVTELNAIEFVDDWILHGIHYVSSHPIVVASSVVPTQDNALVPSQRRERKLRPFRGENSFLEFSLKDLNGRQHALTDYKGKVVLLNFWASWCPPCVHELPSMNKLKFSMRDRPFAVIGINMAEKQAVIEDFLKKAKIDFIILKDENGVVLKQWNVYAFPTSFVLDKNGKIRYAVAGAIHWMDDNVIKIIKQLSEE